MVQRPNWIDRSTHFQAVSFYSMKSQTRFVLLFLGVCVSVILGMTAGVAIQAYRITSQPQSFISLAKLVAGGRMVISSGDAADSENLGAVYSEVLKTLESEEISRRALNRVRALHPDVKESEVEIQASQNKGSDIFNLRAYGTEPKYTRLFLDALLDEFINFRNADPGLKDKKPAVHIMERASSAVEDLQDWALPIAVGVVGGGLVGLLAGLIIAMLIYAATRSSGPPLIPPVA
jgi:hypothetical protein